ncbi:ATP-binding domain-containing protein [Pseudomonas juntendi]|uniref:ATP-binding domain-containing protein n=1 Tax=Pseudomonas juntendi TaxID=2666183 RepID=UPI001B82B943|nr:ATP-binding domain-containing protein [Pseudomonas juntendi]MBR7522555.1 ATP-binding domain-containing protein [Pseudomonas juntendi]
MATQIGEAFLRKVAHEELEVLEGIIDYAERMIREGDLAYRNLKRNAYGKALVIERENEGVATFRLGMDSLVYPKASSGYTTPHSPVGRLCAVAGMGFESFSKAWGEYRVTEARQFRRHDFEELERHARNFLAVGVENANGQGKVMDLRAFLTKANSTDQQIAGKQTTEPSKKSARSNSVEQPVAIVPPIGKELPVPAEQAFNGAGPPNTPVTEFFTHLPDDGQPADEPLELTPSVPVTPQLQILDDDEEEDSTLSIADLDDVEDDVGGELIERMSLDEHFFLNRTPNQDKIISRAPVGPMWVEGVAGSGKTSAALGRTKMLCDFNSNEVTDRETFRSILGDDFDYWEGEFAGKFSQDGSVGFVRTGELIQYLKETCSRLGMPSLPVLEYHELRFKLRNYRNLESSGASGKRFKRSSDEGHSLTTTLAWLNAARLALARVIAADLQSALVEVDSEHLRRFTGQQRRQFAAARQALVASVDELVQELLSPLTAERALYRLAARVLEKIQALAQRILGPATQSVHLGEQMAYGEGIPELAQRLAELPVDLFQQPNQVLVLYRAEAEGAEALPCVSSSRYQYLSADNHPLSFNDAVQASLAGSSVRALLPSIVTAEGYEAKFMPVNELFIALGTPRSLLYLDGEGLKWLKVSSGIGSQVLPGEDEQARTSVRKIFQQTALDYLAKPLKNFAGLYAKALYEHADIFPDAATAWQVLERLEEQRLCETDIDLLLCLAHDLSAGVTATLPTSLREASFYQSVFIDEVQDFSEQQIYLMTSQADPRYSAITVVGDRSQQLLHNEEIHIADCFPIGKRPEFVALDENLRQKGQPDLAALSTVLRQLFERGADTDVQHLDADVLHDQVSEQGAYMMRCFAEREEEFRYLCEVIAAIPENQSVAVVLPDQVTARSLHALCEQELEGSFRKISVSEQIDLSKKYLVHFTSVLHVKGLEFDVVLMPMIDQYDLVQPVFRNRLYVGCTRARQQLLMSRLR